MVVVATPFFCRSLDPPRDLNGKGCRVGGGCGIDGGRRSYLGIAVFARHDLLEFALLLREGLLFQRQLLEETRLFDLSGMAQQRQRE